MVKNKKAQVGEIIFLMITIVSIALTLIIGRYVYVKVQDGLQNSGISTNESEKVFSDMNVSWSIFDNGMIFIVLGLTVILLLTSFMLPTHPAFLVFNIVGLVILVFMGAVMSNLYYNVINQSDISAVLQNTSNEGITDFGKTNFIMLKLPWISAIIILLSTIVMYSKARG